MATLVMRFGSDESFEAGANAVSAALGADEFLVDGSAHAHCLEPHAKRKRCGRRSGMKLTFTGA